jgi:signal peptidase II
MRIFLITTIFCFLTDQITKLLVEEFLTERPLKLLPFLNLILVYNKGFAFGLGQDINNLLKEFLYVFFPLIVVAFIFYLGLFKVGNPFFKFYLGLLAGGGLGNLTDRIILGKVRDFIDFHIGNWHYPAFNIADICVSLGIFFLLLHIGFLEKKKT